MSAPRRLVPVTLCPGSYVWVSQDHPDDPGLCLSCGGWFVPTTLLPAAESGTRRPVQTPAHEAVPLGDPQPAQETTGDPPAEATAAAARALGLAPRPLP